MNKPGFTIFCGNYQRNFFVRENVDTVWTELWKVETEGSQRSSSLIFYDKYLIATDLSGKIYAFDENGKLIGISKYSGSIPSAPIVHNQTLIFVVNDLNKDYSTLIYYDVSIPKTIEKVIISGSVHNELIDVNNGVLVLTDQGTLYKFSYAGLKLSELKTNVQSFCTPAIFDNDFLFGNQNGEIISVNYINNKINYRVKISSGFESGVVIKNQKGFIGSSDGNLFCFDVKDGKILWEVNTGHKIKTLPVMNDSSLFIGNLNGDIFSIKQSNGKLNWKISVGGVIDVTPLLFSNYLLEPNQNKKLDVIDIKNGKVVKSIAYSDKIRTTPLYINNLLFVGIDKGNIYAYKVNTY
ncbi:PQQ-binding-like beta-propeller repeat protein [Melioribacteraceae bacterium 4301-Me]|uniref:outer membrane protein assembly factor BamB family protein n=1 Tax=Pyranulibacter aquaticus TaxID=3163344 RepID=UPI00359A2681